MGIETWVCALMHALYLETHVAWGKSINILNGPAYDALDREPSRVAATLILTLSLTARAGKRHRNFGYVQYNFRFFAPLAPRLGQNIPL